MRYRLKKIINNPKEHSGYDMLETLTDAYIEIDKQWNFTYMNGRAQELLCKNREALIGKSVCSVFSTLKHTESFEKLNSVLSYRVPANWETYSFSLNVWLELNAYPAACGRTAVYFRDITSRKLEEQAAYENKLRYRLLLNSLPQAEWETDGKLKALIDCPSWREFTGQSLQDFLGYGWLNAIHPQDKSWAFEKLMNAVDQGRGINEEYRILGPKSEWRWTNVLAEPVRDDKGNIIKYVGLNIDITKRKEYEERLAYQAKLLSNVHDAICVVDEKGVFSYCNSSFEIMSGWSAEEIVGRLNPGIVPEFKTAMKRALAAYRDKELLKDFEKEVIERVCTRKDGTTFVVDINSTLLIGEKGEYKGFITSMRDAEVRKEYELELIRKEYEYLEVIDSTSEGSFIHDLGKGELYFSYEWKKKLGIEHLNPKEAVCAFKLIHPEDKIRVLRTFSSACRVQSSKIRLEFRVKTIDSGYIWVHVQGKVVFDDQGNPIKYFGTNLDITDLKLSEQALQKSEEKYRMLFNSIDEGFIIFDLIFDKDGNPVDIKYLEVNPAYEKQAGLKNVKGRLASEIFGRPEDNWLQLFSWVATTGEPVRTVEKLERVNKWFSVYAFKIDNLSRGTVAMILKDVTEDVLSKKELKQSLKAQDEIFANISHELKTPLNVIFSTNQLMEYYIKNKLLEQNGDKLINSTNIIRQNCYRFLKIINNVVDLSKIDSGFYRLELDNVNIIEVVEDIIQSVAGYIQGKGLSIIFDTDNEEKIIACDPVKIERILLNLISNAIKFSNPHGVINVNVADYGDSVKISVQDNGIGIEQKYLTSIFKRYHQVDKTLTRNSEGSGIGLSLVKSLVDLHGGEISVESETGKGSTFMVELPARIIEYQSDNSKDNVFNSKVEMINIEFSDIYN